jgi:hypothetical protein
MPHEITGYVEDWLRHPHARQERAQQRGGETGVEARTGRPDSADQPHEERPVLTDPEKISDMQNINERSQSKNEAKSAEAARRANKTGTAKTRPYPPKPHLTQRQLHR